MDRQSIRPCFTPEPEMLIDVNVHDGVIDLPWLLRFVFHISEGLDLVAKLLSNPGSLSSPSVLRVP